MPPPPHGAVVLNRGQLGGYAKKIQCQLVDFRERASDRPAQGDLASRLEILNGLLNTLTDILDIRKVFDRVSQVVQRVLPHDLMGVLEISERGDRIRLYAGTAEGGDAHL